MSVAWLLEGEYPVAPPIPSLHDLAARDFKIAAAPPKLPLGRSLASGLERLVHDLRGVRVGVVLGGGAARGMSHLGVLKVLEEQGSETYRVVVHFAPSPLGSYWIGTGVWLLPDNPFAPDLPDRE